MDLDHSRAGGDGLRGVDTQIGDDLVNLVTIDEHRWQAIRQLGPDVHLRWDCGAEQLHCLLDDVPQLYDRPLRLVLTTERQNLSHEGRGTVTGVSHVDEERHQDMVYRDFPADGGEIAAQHRKDVVEIVRNAGRQRTQRIEFLGVADPLLEQPLFRDVTYNAEEPVSPALIVIQVTTVRGHPAHGAVVDAYDTVLELKRQALAVSSPERVLHLLPLLIWCAEVEHRICHWGV